MNTVTTSKKRTSLSLSVRGLLAGVALFAVSCGSATAQPASFLPFEVQYDVGNNLISAGTATLKLERQGDFWVYSLNTDPTGVFKLTGKGKINEESIFSAGSNGDTLTIKTDRYSYRQDNEAKRSVDASFDWNKNSLTYTKRGEEVTEEISGPIVDRLSVTLTVMDALRTNSFNQTTLKVFDDGRVKTMEFQNEGDENVQAKSGSLKTIRVKSYSVGSARHTLTWFAPELDYVPVKIEQYKRDNLIARLTLTKLRNRVTESGGAEAFK